MRGPTPSSDAYAPLTAPIIREHLAATWALSENGVAGPTGNKYGYAPGHSAIAVSGPVDLAKIVETGSADRVQNMYLFGIATLELLIESLEKSGTK